MNVNIAVVTQLAERVTPLRLDVDAPSDDLGPLTKRIEEAKVVAVGSAVRQSHELLTLTHRVMRFLIEQHGFRSLALEGDYLASYDLDGYVRTGEGDPGEILGRARSFLRFTEIVDAVRWIRGRNEQNPDDQVRIVHLANLPHEAMRLASGKDIEQAGADAIVAWHQQTGDRVVYWGGLAHTANGPTTGKNAGSYLRERFGSGYVSIGMTFHHGSLPSPVDVPPSDYIEAVLGAVSLETYLLEVDGGWSASVSEWLDVPVKTRLIGPGVHELHGPPLRIWVDFVVHSRCISPAGAL